MRPWLVLCVLLLSGCVSGASKLEAPKLSIVQASMTSADPFVQQFLVRVHVDNPNARALPIKKLEYKLFLEGDHFAEGESLKAFVAPANGSTEFDMMVQANFVSGIARLLSRLTGERRSAIRYDFIGKVDVDIRFVPKMTFTESGMVELGRK